MEGFLSIKGCDTEEALPGHLSLTPRSQGEEGAILAVHRDVGAHVGACLTYIPKNTTSWLSTSCFKSRLCCKFIHIE